MVKLCFNVASVGLATSVACLVVVAAGGPLNRSGPRHLGRARVAVAPSTIVSLCAVHRSSSRWSRASRPISGVVRTAVPAAHRRRRQHHGRPGRALGRGRTSRGRVLLLLGLGALLVVVYRSYAQFMRQHRSLAEMYELTRAIGDGRRTTDRCPTRCSAGSGQLLQAEYATLWLPAQGRHPEVLLSARVDDAGLLDVAPTPDALRERVAGDRRDGRRRAPARRRRRCGPRCARPAPRTPSWCRCAPARP